MNLRSATAIVLIVSLFTVASVARAAEIKVLSGGVMRPVLSSIAEDFERSTGHKLVITYASAGAIGKRIQAGESADVAFLSRPAIDGLVKQGKLMGNSTADIVYSAVGIAVRAGAPKPDIRSVEALKQALLQAKSIAYFDPAAGGSSGIHFARVLERLGIAEEINRKAKLVQGPAAELAAKGEVELAIQQVYELMEVPGIDLVGPLPTELQSPIEFTFAAGVFLNAKEPEATKILINFLMSPKLANLYKAKGLEQASR